MNWDYGGRITLLSFCSVGHAWSWLWSSRKEGQKEGQKDSCTYPKTLSIFENIVKRCQKDSCTHPNTAPFSVEKTRAHIQNMAAEKTRTHIRIWLHFRSKRLEHIPEIDLSVLKNGSFRSKNTRAQTRICPHSFQNIDISGGKRLEHIPEFASQFSKHRHFDWEKTRAQTRISRLFSKHRYFCWEKTWAHTRIYLTVSRKDSSTYPKKTRAHIRIAQKASSTNPKTNIMFGFVWFLAWAQTRKNH